MACLLQPECNFLHGYFRCCLPVEVVGVEVKITSMQRTHIFLRDRTTQLIKCTPWSSRLCPHPTIIKKMRTFLEVKGKLGPIPLPSSNQYRLPQPDTNPNIRKATKATEKRKRVAPTKRFKANVAKNLIKQPHNHLQQLPKPQPTSKLKHFHKKELQKVDPHH